MTKTLNVKGMTCGHCEKAVKNALLQLEGVEAVEIHLDSGKVDVTFNNDKVNVPQLKEAVEDQGYDVA